MLAFNLLLTGIHLTFDASANIIALTHGMCHETNFPLLNTAAQLMATLTTRGNVMLKRLYKHPVNWYLMWTSMVRAKGKTLIPLKPWIDGVPMVLCLVSSSLEAKNIHQYQPIPCHSLKQRTLDASPNGILNNTRLRRSVLDGE